MEEHSHLLKSTGVNALRKVCELQFFFFFFSSDLALWVNLFMEAIIAVADC